jgi:hypothetical protein
MVKPGEPHSARQRAVAELIKSIEHYRPRYHLTQSGLSEPERMRLKIELFIAHQQRKVLQKDDSYAS